MRLIHTESLQLHTFEGASIPEYAILSHQWGNEEVSYVDFKDVENRGKLEGWRKITACCELAATTGHKYVWIDTCCIDKSVSQASSVTVLPRSATKMEAEKGPLPFQVYQLMLFDGAFG